ncbi:phage baseplate assembly protein V, partial [Flavobacterium jumunjinense]
PSGLGRVQVKFAWQDGNSPWIRMINPHAGGGKGMYFIPEIGEEVLVGFEAGNAEKPFVLGAMYNGSASSAYATSGNDKKVIQSRSGTKIIMNDAEGSVFVEDPSGNTWMMDGKGNISVNATKNFSIAAGENVSISAGKNISVSAGANIDNSANENITTVAGTDIIQSATGDIKESSDKRTEIVDKDFMRQADISNEIASEVSIFSEKENMTLQSGKTVEFNSAEKSKLF